MGYDIWDTLFDADDCSKVMYVCRQTGSPYQETVIEKKQEYTEVQVNPYLKLYEILNPLLKNREWFTSKEGKAIFHFFVDKTYQLESYRGWNRDAIVRDLIREEILDFRMGQLGMWLYQNADKKQKICILDGILMQRDGIAHERCLFYVVQAFFPHAMLFCEKENRDHLYLWVNQKKTRMDEKRMEAVKWLFLPLGNKLSISWTTPFLLTNLNTIDAQGKHISK